jgi:hypothetical protein
LRLVIDSSSSLSTSDFIGDYGLARRALAQHIVIPEADNMKALRLEPPGAFRIRDSASIRRVLSAMNLDNEATTEPREIDNVGTDRRLPPKRNPVVAERAQEIP